MEKIDLKNEVITLLIVLIAGAILLKVIFFSESIEVIGKLSISLFWLYLLPGFMLMYIFPHFSFLERLIIGMVAGMAYFGVIGYNLGLLGIPLNVQIWILPIIAIGIGGYFLYKNQVSKGDTVVSKESEQT